MFNINKPNPKEHLNIFLNLLEQDKPFTFIRFSDGEVEVLRNRSLIISNKKTFFRGGFYKNNFPDLDKKTFNPSLHRNFRRDLINSCIYKDKFYYKGIRTFNISDPQALQDREFLLRLNGGFDEFITFSDLLINNNYLAFRRDLMPLILNSPNEKIIISNWRSKINFKFFRHIKLSDDFIPNYENEIKLILSKLDDIPQRSIVLCSASSLTNILGHKLFQTRKDLTFLDIGTSINDLLSLPINTRTYHNILTKYKDYGPILRSIKYIINDLVIRW